MASSHELELLHAGVGGGRLVEVATLPLCLDMPSWIGLPEVVDPVGNLPLAVARSSLAKMSSGTFFFSSVEESHNGNYGVPVSTATC